MATSGRGSGVVGYNVQVAVPERTYRQAALMVDGSPHVGYRG